MFILRKMGMVLAMMSVLIMGAHGVASAGQEGIQEENRKKLMATNSCQNCDLSGMNLDRIQLQGANLEGANLSQAKVRLSSLAKANLRNTNLRNAQFGGSDLADADLRGADLQGATFVGAYLVGAQLDKDAVVNQSSAEIAAVSGSAPEKKEVARTGQGGALSVPENPSPEEAGFLDRTWDGMKGLFGQGEKDAKKVNPASTEMVEAPVEVGSQPVPTVQQPAIEKAVAAPSVSVKDEPVAAVQVKSESLPLQGEEGFLDKTWDGITSLFGQDDDAKKVEPVPVEKKIVSADEIALSAPEPVKKSAAVVAPSIPVTNETGAIIIIEESVVVEGEPDVPVAPVAPVVERKEVGVQEDTVKKASNVQEEKTKVEGKAAGSVTPVVPVSEVDVLATKEKNRLQALDTKKCYGCKLQGVDFSGKNLSEVDFEGADLTGSNLVGANLENANLKVAILVGADLRGADLHGADLYKANLSKADLTGANMKDALLDDAQLVDTIGYKL